MFHSRLVRLLAVALVSAGVIWFLARDQPIALESPPTPPRPEPVAEPGSSALPFASVDDPHLSTGNELRRLHNELVEDLAKAIADYEAGTGSIRVAEQIEMRILVARHDIGVMRDQAFHAGLAFLFARELTRLEQLATMDKPKAGELEVANARLFVARERHLAGEPDIGYGEQRAALIVVYQDRIEHLRALKSRTFEGLTEDLHELLGEFPAPASGPDATP